MPHALQRIASRRTCAERTLRASATSLALGLATAMLGPNAHAGTPEQPVPAASAGASFDATAAWIEFCALLRDGYGYFERPGIDGPAILLQFEPRARAVRSRDEFVGILKLVARNFADPHFVVGPMTPNDPSVIPTGSDLYATRRDGRYVIVDVRADGDAQRQGVEIGDEVLDVDGVPIVARIVDLLGRGVDTLSPIQVDHGLNVALAGIRNRPRVLTVLRGGARRRFELAPTYAQANAIDARPPLTVERRGRVGLIRVNNSLGREATVEAFRAALVELADTDGLILDLRDTPSGGNTVVARGIMGHFVDRERPYQVHVVPYEQRHWGVPRKFVEYVLPIAPRYRPPLVVLGGRWTGSMGDGLMVGFDALGVPTVGSPLGHLLGALFNRELEASGARVDLGLEQLFTVDGRPREAFVPRHAVAPAEAGTGRGGADPALDLALEVLRRAR